MIPQDLLEKIAAANDIVEVISGYFPLKRAGSAYKANCPFHQERSPSFTVTPSRQFFKCFGCGASGSVFGFVERYESVSFPEAVRRLAARAGIRMEETPMTPEEDARHRSRRRILSLHAEATEWFHRNLLRTKAAQHARDYLKGRGITGETAKSWKLGYAPDSFSAFTVFAHQNGYTDQELIASGLVTSKEGEEHRYYDRFRDRLMFPICNEQGETIAFSGRVLSAEAFGGKYVNSPETPIFTKGKALFGIDKTKRAIIEKKSAIVCEGQLDLITAFEAGIKNVTAPQGTAFTMQQAQIVKRLAQEEVVLCFDSDAAGLKAAERSLPALLGVGLSVRVALMPPEQDPDSFIRGQGADAFSAIIAAAPDYFDFQIEHFAQSPDFGTPRGKATFTRKIAEAISLISDPILRETVVNSVSTRMEIPREEVMNLLQKRDKTPQPYRDDPEPTPEETVAPPRPMSHATRLLCQLVLLSREARDLILKLPWQPLIAQMEDGELLSRLLVGSYQPGEIASITSYLATLSPAEQTEVTNLLDSKQIPADPARVAEECWRDLERRNIEQERKVLTARLRKPGLPMEEVIKLQKQVLDLTQRHHHITRPLSPAP